MEKILIVEDREENRKAARTFFDRLGKFSVDYASNLKEGKEKLQNNKYFLAIFDLDMPNEEGGQIVEKAGLELGKIAKEKNIFYIYYSGGFFHGTPRTKVYSSEEDVLNNRQYELIPDTYSKESPQGWEELWNKLVALGKPMPDVEKELKESVKRYEKHTGKIPEVPKIFSTYIFDISSED
jgi:CheY-like chemotaxis protein